MKKGNAKSVTSKDLDKFVEQEIKDIANDKQIHLFKNQNVAVSVSDSPEIEMLGFSNNHQKNLITEITRYLVIHGSKLVYGGDLRQNGYTRLFSDLVYQYRPTKEANKKFFKNYFSFPIYLKLKTSDELEFKKNGVEPIKIPAPEHLDIDTTKFYPPDSKENLFIWAESLSKMRLEMQSSINARIFTGGNMSNFKGKYPGLLEEALLALKEDTPVYLVGIFGGITQRIIMGIQGSKPKELTLDWQSKVNDRYGDFVRFYNSMKTENIIDYSNCTDFLNNYTLGRISKNNGLTIEENKRLFTSIHTSEIIFLIMKGLLNVSKK
ncbi:hypothetical protein [Croceivirga thetidis]|uniref:Uncharacterized protein n=1 Tax=Croceivirga thetidis TaxID=2721623 RepID=A0ABX1GPS6_9FLAO|nr:hypothetical protein [Croceivirga thetidis]NKI30777.1 hypothetical protein [Croceivirga thetidis]